MTSSDGVHWKFPVGRKIIKSALDKVGIGRVLQDSNTPSHCFILHKHCSQKCFHTDVTIDYATSDGVYWRFPVGRKM